MQSDIQMTMTGRLLKRQAMAAAAVLLLTLCLSCSHTDSAKVRSRHDIIRLMDRADALLGTDDSAAMAALDSIDAASISGRKQNARYALLYSEAMYKNYIPAGSDSLIMVAVRYYSVGSDIESRFRAFYQLGCIYAEMNRKPDALLAFTQAEHLSVAIKDDYKLGLLNTQLGNAFFKSFDFSRALGYYKTAFSYYSKAYRNSHKIHALYNIACCEMQLDSFKQAYSTFDTVQTMASDIEDNYLLFNCLLNKLNCSMFSDDVVLAESDMKQITELCGDSFDDAISLSTFAKYNILTGNFQKARLYLDKGWENSMTLSDSISMYDYESILLEEAGKYDSAIVMCRNAISMERQNFQFGMGHPLTGAMSDYYKNISEIEMLKVSRNHFIFIIFIIIFMAAVIVFVFSIRSRRLKYESDRQSLILTINELRLREDSSNDTINQLNAKINSLFRRPLLESEYFLAKIIDADTFISSGRIKPETERTKLYQSQTDILYKELKKKFDTIVSDGYQDELDKIINSSCDNIMEQIINGQFAISKKDLLIIRLSIAGFSPNSISYLTGNSRTSVYKQRQRTIAKIEGKDPELALMICNILSIR